MDRVTPRVRSKIMAAVKTSHTGPELAIRRALHRLGYRYSLHAADLPGRPDLVFRSRGKIVFVHGCFWHGHKCSKGGLPKSNLDYWAAKIDSNRARDHRTVARLKRLGWSVLTVWQCQMHDLNRVVDKVVLFLESP